ncbi:MAG: hypothetical protein QOK29_3736 [Rhodospirillaceae bacterium]|nr:hypothetical protein [Rhodospirillaceae bacterium]
MLEIVGYPDRLAVRPNETIAFKVSCEAGAQQYRADIVRLRCGDDRPGGPGFREEVVDAKVNGDYPSRVQPIDCGSYVVVPPSTALDKVRSFTLAALIWPTLPGTGEQTIMGRWQTAPSGGIGYVLGLDPSGRPSLRIGKEGQVWELVARRSLRARRWYRLMASFDAGSGEAALHYEALERDWGDPGAEMITDRSALMPGPNDNQPFTMGAHITAPSAPVQHSAGHFNGKIEAPRLAAAPLAPAEIDDLLTHRQHPALVAAWDFAQDIPTTIVRDAGPNRLDGRCVNLPARGVTGHCWAGESFSWRERRAEYGAIHFHEDDLQDCAWQTDFSWTIPADLRSGIYAVRLRCGIKGEDHVPFFVLPDRRRTTAPVAFLASSATYMAYANSHDAYEDPTAEICHGALLNLSATDLFLMRRRDFGVSTYDVHRDGSGSFYSSRLRPILNMRPKRALWNFNADLHVIDWLEAQGQSYDVIDDETLEAEGAALLQGYRCIMTGTHPEYHSTGMLDAFTAYLDHGGRLMYLGGNGFYWRIGWHREIPGVIEVRRGESGTRTWAGEPGENHLSTTGEPGGLWRSAGRAPQRLVGIGYASEGFDVGSYYRRLPDSYDPRAGFIFHGIGEGPIGDFGAFDGAAALELDIIDPRLGTPSNTLRLAASENHSNIYLLTPEELITNYPGADGIESPLVRADMVFFETPAGGAVFSTGSIGWAASLAHAAYENDVSRITGNVLRRFLDPAPFPAGQEQTRSTLE